MHPDPATSDAERDRRNVIIAKVNVAYGKGELAAIEKLIIEFGQDPEAITGSDIAARLVKTIRRIAHTAAPPKFNKKSRSNNRTQY